MYNELATMRIEYESHGLDESDVGDDPIEFFELWLASAVEAGLADANAMVVCTVDAAGKPWSRNVLLKGLSANGSGAMGFEFYSNYESNKGRHLAANPTIAATFSWLGLHRQVCITGLVERLSETESDDYFALRPRGSQLGAWASAQSEVIADRAELSAKLVELEARFGDAVPRPAMWGGYRIIPDTIEFWQGQANRLHDRLRFSRDNSKWTLNRLAP